eukprot:CAMPEP_0185036618 /NCGR_PEP_ID=MMETSP1103-20130426/29818_1 /TAXON_ID=36769 /ORGANISM="Paraphysomonas bandaiensis, Strain Caron Lab Isolate" /LENGTH=453 /DNA_ID=CAMNT_0027574213 /DNA_START=143 /DNA_END=1504 /DNA_ORIENTATION=-
MQSIKNSKISQWSNLSTKNPPFTHTSNSTTFISKLKVTCTDGLAGEYPCSGIDLWSVLYLSDLGCTYHGNEVWGWTDEYNHEIVIAGCYSGTSFIDISVPEDPYIVCTLPAYPSPSSWRDIKVFNNYAYIGSEASDSGIQVINLTAVSHIIQSYMHNPNQFQVIVSSRGYRRLNITLQETFIYTDVGSSHNLVLNEQSGFLYVVGSDTCAGGLHVINLSTPAEPEFAGCFEDLGYIHDAQCVIYTGPDERYTGRELCFTFNGESLSVVDVTDKSNMVILVLTDYSQRAYCHQGWLTEDMRYLLADDEVDELKTIDDGRTHTYVWDMKNITEPKLVNTYRSSETSIDHNQYIHQGYSWQANYCAGLRVLNVSSLSEDTSLDEVAYFDVAPECNTTSFLGAWTAYPKFDSGTIAVNTIDKGLFILSPQSTRFGFTTDEHMTSAPSKSCFEVAVTK